MHNRVPMRCAAYARYSSDNQREASINDQLRKCREYAESKGWTLLPEHVYVDEAISGAGVDRPGLNRLLETAYAQGKRAFEVVLVDDTSRLSRSLADSVRMAERLKFEGVRLVAVSQGIDSHDEQSDVMMTVHSLVDSLYIKELAKKTHRGLEGLALQGFHTGGRCFGYKTVDSGDGRKRYEINLDEAIIVRRIFEMAANGISLKKMAKMLNEDGIVSPRPGSKKKYDTWCPTAIRDMLRREIYIGRIVWNKSKWIKKPGTNRRVRRPRPETEWKIVDRPELRIISEECWEAVQRKIAFTMKKYSEGARKGLANRADTSHYILSGFLKCNCCGANLVIVSGRGSGRWSRYGCSQRWNRGACKNDLTVRRADVEAAFFGELQSFASLNHAIEFLFQEFVSQLRAAIDSGADSIAKLNKRKAQLETEIESLIDALAKGVSPATLKKRIAEREHELSEVRKQLKTYKREELEDQFSELKKFVEERVQHLASLIESVKPNAKYELTKHMDDVWMVPAKNAEGERFYFGVGKWDLLGGLEPLLSHFRDLLDFVETLRVRCIAKKTTARAFSTEFPQRGNLQRLGVEQLAMQKLNAHGAELNVGVRNVAGAGFEPATFGL